MVLGDRGFDSFFALRLGCGSENILVLHLVLTSEKVGVRRHPTDLEGDLSDGGELFSGSSTDEPNRHDSDEVEAQISWLNWAPLL